MTRLLSVNSDKTPVPSNLSPVRHWGFEIASGNPPCPSALGQIVWGFIAFEISISIPTSAQPLAIQAVETSRMDLAKNLNTLSPFQA